MIKKVSTRFRVYEGVRIGEIQAATNGDVSCWAWMSGQNNVADWLTRGRSPDQLDNDSQWWNGPPILYIPVEDWGLKFKPQQDEPLPGETKVKNMAMTSGKTSLIDYKRYSDINKLVWIVARLFGIARMKTFRGGKTLFLSSKLLKDAENFMVKDVQKSIQDELKKTDRNGRMGGRYANLNPILDENGFWVIGKRLRNNNPMMADSSLQKLLPFQHHITRLIMLRAHSAGHRSRDATLARFRQKYWVTQGSKLAQSVKSRCQKCKLREARFQEQEMGLLPQTRLKPAPTFNCVMLDLFGPYSIREVQKRTTGKAYGVIFTDLVMRAGHIEAAFGYDTDSFLLTFSRFVSVRGWPEVINSDPGSQLIGAERKLREAWEKIDRTTLYKKGLTNGLNWVAHGTKEPSSP